MKNRLLILGVLFLIFSTGEEVCGFPACKCVNGQQMQFCTPPSGTGGAWACKKNCDCPKGNVCQRGDCVPLEETGGTGETKE